MEETNDTTVEPIEDPSIEPELLVEPVASEAPAVPAQEPVGKPQPTRFQLFFRKALLWLTLFAISFLAGAVAMYVIRLQPAQSRLDVVETELIEANQEIEDLESFEAENQILSAKLESTTAHLELLQVLVDVNTARLALLIGDPEAAQVALEGTDQHLETVLPQIESYDPTLAETLPQRLSLIQSNLETDPDTAAVDFDLLMKDLLKVENALFPGE